MSITRINSSLEKSLTELRNHRELIQDAGKDSPKLAKLKKSKTTLARADSTTSTESTKSASGKRRRKAVKIEPEEEKEAHEEVEEKQEDETTSDKLENSEPNDDDTDVDEQLEDDNQKDGVKEQEESSDDQNGIENVILHGKRQRKPTLKSLEFAIDQRSFSTNQSKRKAGSRKSSGSDRPDSSASATENDEKVQKVFASARRPLTPPVASPLQKVEEEQDVQVEVEQDGEEEGEQEEEEETEAPETLPRRVPRQNIPYSPEGKAERQRAAAALVEEARKAKKKKSKKRKLAKDKRVILEDNPSKPPRVYVGAKRGRKPKSFHENLRLMAAKEGVEVNKRLRTSTSRLGTSSDRSNEKQLKSPTSKSASSSPVLNKKEERNRRVREKRAKHKLLMQARKEFKKAQDDLHNSLQKSKHIPPVRATKTVPVFTSRPTPVRSDASLSRLHRPMPSGRCLFPMMVPPPPPPPPLIFATHVPSSYYSLPPPPPSSNNVISHKPADQHIEPVAEPVPQPEHEPLSSNPPESSEVVSTETAQQLLDEAERMDTEVLPSHRPSGLLKPLCSEEEEVEDEQMAEVVQNGDAVDQEETTMSVDTIDDQSQGKTDQAEVPKVNGQLDKVVANGILVPEQTSKDGDSGNESGGDANQAANKVPTQDSPDETNKVSTKTVENDTEVQEDKEEDGDDDETEDLDDPTVDEPETYDDEQLEEEINLYDEYQAVKSGHTPPKGGQASVVNHLPINYHEQLTQYYSNYYQQYYRQATASARMISFASPTQPLSSRPRPPPISLQPVVADEEGEDCEDSNDPTAPSTPVKSYIDFSGASYVPNKKNQNLVNNYLHYMDTNAVPAHRRDHLAHFYLDKDAFEASKVDQAEPEPVEEEADPAPVAAVRKRGRPPKNPGDHGQSSDNLEKSIKAKSILEKSYLQDTSCNRECLTKTIKTFKRFRDFVEGNSKTERSKVR